MTSKEEYKEAILRYVDETDWVSFADLHQRFAGDANHETQIALPGNRIVWTGMPLPMIDAVLELLEEEALAAVPAHKSAYVRAGRVLSLPVEKTIPPEGHAEPHWYPVLLRPIRAVQDAPDILNPLPRERSTG